MYKVRLISHFSAAHSLRGYHGKCEVLHGHNWKVEVVVSSDKLDSIGMVIDFNKLRKTLKLILEKIDHKYLNELEYFKNINPSSEEIARYIFGELEKKFLKKPFNLVEVSVWETDTSGASYSH